jgi:mannosyltransferase
MAGLTALMALAAALRFYHLGRRSYWSDEGTSLAIAGLDWWNFLRVLWRREANMALHYLLLRGWIHLGTSEAVVRSLSAIFGVLTVWAIFALGRKLSGASVGAIAALLLAINAYHIRYSQEARAYSLVTLLVILSYFFLVELLERPTGKTSRAYILASVLSVYSHFYALLALLAQWLVIRFLKISEPVRIAIRRAMRIIALALLPLLIFIVTTGAGPLAWLTRPGWHDLHILAVYLTGGDGDILLALYGAAVLLAALRLRRAAESVHEVMLFAWLTIPVLVVFALSILKPVFMNRFLIFCLPALCLLAALGIMQLKAHWMKALLLVAIVGFSLRGVAQFENTGMDQPIEDWRAATAYILSHAAADQGILFYSAQGRMPYEAYAVNAEATANHPAVIFPAHAAQLTYLDFMGKPEPSQLEALSGHYKRIWLVLSHDLTPAGWDAPTRSIQLMLAQNYSLAEETKFPGVTVMLYESGKLAQLVR